MAQGEKDCGESVRILTAFAPGLGSLLMMIFAGALIVAAITTSGLAATAKRVTLRKWT